MLNIPDVVQILLEQKVMEPMPIKTAIQPKKIAMTTIQPSIQAIPQPGLPIPIRMAMAIPMIR